MKNIPVLPMIRWMNNTYRCNLNEKQLRKLDRDFAKLKHLLQPIKRTKYNSLSVK